MRGAIAVVLLCCGGAVQTGAAAAPLPPLAARFETVHCALPCKKPVARRWTLARDAQAVELRGEGAPYSELWRRLAGGRVGYAFLMHDERRAIEYSPVDLEMIGRAPDWERLGALLSPRDLARLERGAKGRHGAYATRRYAGTLGGAKVEAQWITTLGLPAKLTYRYPGHTVTVRLLALDAGAPPAPGAALAAYELVDYADIGDMEGDPQAEAWIRKAAAAPGHAHPGHGH